LTDNLHPNSEYSELIGIEDENIPRHMILMVGRLAPVDLHLKMNLTLPHLALKFKSPP
jgi:hypothetical protein